MGRTEDEFLKKHHNHDVRENQCSSYLVKRLKAPVDLVWSLVRRFNEPQNYMLHLTGCDVQCGDLKIGSIRQVNVRSGVLDTTTVTERLEILDDEERVISVSLIEGDHRMRNYTSIVSVHPEMIDGRKGTLVVESYVVDVADGKSKEETCFFVESLIKSNLRSLAHLSEKFEVKERTRVPVKQVVKRNERSQYVKTDVSNFMSVVQKLTGIDSTNVTLPPPLLDSKSSRVQESLSHYNPESNSISDVLEEAIEDKRRIKQDTVLPIEVESEFLLESSNQDESLESSNQDGSSLTVDWTAQQVNLTNWTAPEINLRCSELSSLTVDWTAQQVNLTNLTAPEIELPENPSCPFLVKLFLQHNTYLTEIPPSFFEHMPVLRVLDMSNTSIKTLPSSISKLFRLRELLLRGCEMLMELPPEIGRLTNLKVLDLEGTELVCLPKQVGWLLQLECLKFSLYKYADHHKESKIISKETLSKLSSLKELSIDVYPDCEWWDAEVKAIIADLGKLGNLETLKLYLPTYELFQQLLQRRCIKRLERDVVMPLLYPTLSSFRFVVGRHEDPIMSCVPRDLQDEFMKQEKCLKYVNSEECLDGKALEHVGALFLHRHCYIRTLSEFDLGKMDNLKFCLLAECDWMRAILDGQQLNRLVDNKGRKSILGSLCYLGIHYMKNLRSIWTGPLVNGCLSSLKILAIHTCPNLTTIFNHGFLDELIFLQELIIEDCPKVESLVAHDYALFKKGLFPSLKKISLLHLPELKNISCGQCIASRLEKMVIYNCPKLKNLHPLETCSKGVKEIKGESKWWESNKSGWNSEQHDYLVRVFVPLKVDDDDNDDDDDAGDDSIDELAEAVRISLTSQVSERNEDLVANMDIEMEKGLEEHPKETGTSKKTIKTFDDLINNMDMIMEDKLEEHPKEIGTSKSMSDELVFMELVSSEFSTRKFENLSSSKFYWCLVAEPRKNPEFPFASFARTLGLVNLSDYNLSDDSIPMDLTVLSSLWELDLSFTQISTLHKGIKWPNGLKFLKLNGCRNLRFLPELPLLEVLSVNECRALERVNFGSNKLNSAPVSLLSHGCDRLVEVESVFRLEPIEKFNAEVTNTWGFDNLKSLGNVEVELCNNMTRTRRKLPLQGLFEFGILSTFLPKTKIPRFFSNMQPGSSIMFKTQNLNRLQGLNVCIIYGRSKEYKHEQYYDFHIEVVDSSKVLKWTYYPTVYGDGEDDTMWLSYWDMKDHQIGGAGATMTVSVVVGSGFEVKECGACLVYGKLQEIITPITTCKSTVVKNQPYVSLPLPSHSNVHSRRGHNLFLDPLKYRWK